MSKDNDLNYKINIKTAVDLVYMFSILIFMLFVLMKREITDIGIISSVFLIFFGFIVQYEFFRHWMVSSLKTTIKDDIKSADESAKKILSFCNSQKDSVAHYSSSTKEVKHVADRIQKTLIIMKQNLQNTLNIVQNTVNTSEQ